LPRAEQAAARGEQDALLPRAEQAAAAAVAGALAPALASAEERLRIATEQRDEQVRVFYGTRIG
jgi:hypothetical protein